MPADKAIVGRKMQQEPAKNPAGHQGKKGFLPFLRRILKIPVGGVGKIRRRSPVLNRLYFDNYARVFSRYYTLSHRLGLLRPRQVQWLTTYGCNFRCIHCEASAGTTRVRELTTEEAFRLVDELAEAGVRIILLSGGELLVRADIFLIIDHILRQGLTYSLASNGYLVSQFTEEFRRMKPALYFTSIDGLEETSDAIRGVSGAFRRCLDSVAFFRSLGVRHITINTVVLPQNIGELPALKKIIQESGATLWRLAIPIPVGRAKENPALSLNAGQVHELFEFIRSAKKEMPIEISEDAGYLGAYAQDLRASPFFCRAGLTQCAIMPDGEVMGCQIAYDNSLSEGTVRTRPFQEIWEQGFSRFRSPQHDVTCRSCRHLEACRGGCWGMRLGNKHCQKEVWDEQNPD